MFRIPHMMARMRICFFLLSIWSNITDSEYLRQIGEMELRHSHVPIKSLPNICVQVDQDRKSARRAMWRAVAVSSD
jgi:hypothetical protein